MARQSVIAATGLLFFFAVMAAALVVSTGQSNAVPGPWEIVLVLAGMAAMAAVTAFQRYLEKAMESRPTAVHFDDRRVAIELSRVRTDTEVKEVAAIEVDDDDPKRPWDLTSGELVGVDNALALARLRMDIERELRRLAFAAGLKLRERPLGALALAHELQRREILPPTIQEPLREIISACNEAVHGYVVSDEVATSIVSRGVEIIDVLRDMLIAAHKGPSTQGEPQASTP